MSTPTKDEVFEQILRKYYCIDPEDLDGYTAEEIQETLSKHFPSRNATIHEVHRWIILWLSIRQCLQISRHFSSLSRMYWSGTELYELPKKQLYNNLRLWGVGAPYSYGIMVDIVRARSKVFAEEISQAEIKRLRASGGRLRITPADRLSVINSEMERYLNKGRLWEHSLTVILNPKSAEFWKTILGIDGLNWAIFVCMFKRFRPGPAMLRKGVLLAFACFGAFAIWTLT